MSDCPVSSNEYRDRFIKYVTDLGVSYDIAFAEYESQVDSHYESKKDTSDPEWDAQEAISYWD